MSKNKKTTVTPDGNRVNVNRNNGDVSYSHKSLPSSASYDSVYSIDREIKKK